MQKTTFPGFPFSIESMKEPPSLRSMKNYLFFAGLLWGLIASPAALCGQLTDTASIADTLPEAYLEQLNRKWTLFQSYEGKFKVQVPDLMLEKVDTVETPIGKLAYHTFFYQDPTEYAENVLYMISYCDYPSETIHSDSVELVEALFETTMDAAAFSIDGELVYQTPVSLAGYPGRFWRINYLNNQAAVKTRAYFVENRYYAVQTIMYRALSLNRASDRFLESFRLMEF